MQHHYWSLSLRLFPLMHMKQSTSSHIHPIYGELLSGPGLHFHYPCFLGWRVASVCHYQGLRACHLSQLSSSTINLMLFTSWWMFFGWPILPDTAHLDGPAWPPCATRSTRHGLVDRTLSFSQPVAGCVMQESHFKSSHFTGHMSPSFSTTVMQMKADRWDLSMIVIIINGSPSTDVIHTPHC